jgi:tryptophan-rich sensory protein
MNRPRPQAAAPKPHPRRRVIVAIWLALFVAGVVGAILFQHNDPNTDDGAGWGALILIAGMVLTVGYLAVSSLLNSRQAGTESVYAPRAPGSRRRTAVIVGASIAAAVLLYKVGAA